MSIDNIVFVVCTARKEKEITLIEHSLQDIGLEGYELHTICENEDSLSKNYNEFIEESVDYYDDDTAIVFVHDDVYLNCSDIHRRLSNYLEEFDVVGVAGAAEATIKEPALWHLISPQHSHRGCVAHYVGGKKSHLEYMPYRYTSFGPLNQRALLIDGVFIATKPSILEDVRFDSQNPSRFHYYDLDFSLNCNSKKKTIGVCDIPIVHRSPGLRNADDEWRAGKQWFLKKWG